MDFMLCTVEVEPVNVLYVVYSGVEPVNVLYYYYYY